jgi:hypothetical protein
MENSEECTMKRRAFFFAPVFGYAAAQGTVLAQKPCQSEIASVGSHRYFLVLAGRSGIFYDHSGPTFPMLIKIGDKQPQIDAVGIYSNARQQGAFGVIPAAAYNNFMKEPGSSSDVMLRLEITDSEYDRCLKIIQSWERRARENNLLYSSIYLDNIVLVKQVTECLNQCGQRIKLYNLDWGLEDTISEHNIPSLTPFLYFKELRRLNETLHVPDQKFNALRR